MVNMAMCHKHKFLATGSHQAPLYNSCLCVNNKFHAKSIADHSSLKTATFSASKLNVAIQSIINYNNHIKIKNLNSE